MTKTNIATRIKKLINQKRIQYRRLMKKGDPVAFTLPTGSILYIYPSGQIAELLYMMHFEYDLLSLVDRYLKKGMHVVDVGANCGIYSILAAKNVTQKGKVWSFEPASDSMARLKSNMSANDLNNYVPEQAALSYKTGGYLDLVNEDNQGDGYRYLTRAKGNMKEFTEHERVAVYSLDAYLKKANEVRVDFLKVDVEGGSMVSFVVQKGFLLRIKTLLYSLKVLL
jgi:FkbM family methyltransferase